MILFLNFAPITFMGGAEKWMNETAKKIDKKEPTILVSVAGSIASIYSSIVLKRRFDSRANIKEIHNHISLETTSFIPFTKNWQNARQTFKKARLIYVRYELLEFLILFYFIGITGIRKTIAGLHSPFIYQTPLTFFDYMHNILYQSFLSKKILSSVKKVHVLNKRDLRFMQRSFALKNVTYVPNGMPIQRSSTNIKQDGKLHILYVGELSLRKGADRLIEVIQQSPKNFVYTIAGDGPFKKEIEILSKQYSNCIFKGFVPPNKLPELYKTNEVLFLPSRAESMPLSILEALSYGLLTVTSKESTLNLSDSVEYISMNNKSKNYINIFRKIFEKKNSKKLNLLQVKRYFNRNFSTKTIDPFFLRSIINFDI